MKGEGLLLRDPGKLPPSARKQLEKVGNEKITSIKLVRTPLSSTTKTFLNIITLGQFEKLSKKYYDDLFHLSMFINGKYNLEKDEVIKFGTTNPVKSNSETRDITVGKNITFNELFENTRKSMGDAKFTSYDAASNNCQNFLLAILNSNGIGTDADKKWIKQDTDELFKEIPAFSKVLGNIATTAGAVVNRLAEGEGRPRRLYQEKDGRYYYMQNGKKRYVKGDEGMSQQQIVRINIGELVKPKKKRKRRKRRIPIKPRILGEFKGMPPPPVFIYGQPPIPPRPTPPQYAPPAPPKPPIPPTPPQGVPIGTQTGEIPRRPKPEGVSFGTQTGEMPRRPKPESVPFGVQTDEVPRSSSIPNLFTPPRTTTDNDVEYVGTSSAEESVRRRRSRLPTIVIDEDSKEDVEVGETKENRSRTTSTASTIPYTMSPTARPEIVDRPPTNIPMPKPSVPTSVATSERLAASEIGTPLSTPSATVPASPVNLTTIPEGSSPTFEGINLVELANQTGETVTASPASLLRFRRRIAQQNNVPLPPWRPTGSTTIPKTEVTPKVGQEGNGEEETVKPASAPCNIYSALNLDMSSLPIGLANNNPYIKTDGLTATPATTPATEPQKTVGKGYDNIMSRTMGFGFGMVGGCHGMDMCQCGDGKLFSRPKIISEEEIRKRIFEKDMKTLERVMRPNYVIPEIDPEVKKAMIKFNEIEEAQSKLPKIFEHTGKGMIGGSETESSMSLSDTEDPNEFLRYKKRLRRKLKALEKMIRRNSNQDLLNTYEDTWNEFDEETNDDDPIREGVLTFEQIQNLAAGGGDVDGLYNDEIEDIADKMGFDVPVIASDEMNKVINMVSPKTKEFGFIINVVPSSSDGSGTDGYRSGHWRAVYVNNEDDLPSIEFFDPLGDAPEPELIDGFRKLADRIDSDKLMLFKENMVKRQANDTNTCGHFALKFLEDRFNGVPWTEATGYDKCDQSKEGEREIKNSVKKYEGYL